MKIVRFVKIGLIGFVGALVFAGLQRTVFANATPTIVLAWVSSVALFYGSGRAMYVIVTDANRKRRAA